MKHHYLAFLIALFFTSATQVCQAQTANNQLAFGFHAGLTEYNGDLGNEYFTLNDVQFASGISVSAYVTPSFDFTGTLSHSKLDATARYAFKLQGFHTKIVFTQFMAKYKLANGKILKADFPVQPWIAGGFGNVFSTADHYVYDVVVDETTGETRQTSRTRADFSFPIGVGVTIPAGERFQVVGSSVHNYVMSDNLDHIENGKMNDQFMMHSIGLVYSFSTLKDTDGDGIKDKDDACPTEVGLPGMKGCPDSDSDGIADKDDTCPNDAGSAAMGGCPDTDGDGIADKDDTCPTEAGKAEMGGCPDGDGDGIADKNDECPTKAGLAEFNGCPDTDADGIEDRKDDCPNAAGPAALKGCPDTDGDGIADKDDKCPTVAGIKANKGCPAVKEEVKAVMQKAMKGLFFETGSAVIKKSSFSVLDEVATVMLANTSYKLKIDGYTDSSGKADKNLKLSQERSAAAKAYLVEKGVDASRMTAAGHGIENPVASNDTSAGRAQNRRVEFTIDF